MHLEELQTSGSDGSSKLFPTVCDDGDVARPGDGVRVVGAVLDCVCVVATRFAVRGDALEDVQGSTDRLAVVDVERDGVIC